MAPSATMAQERGGDAALGALSGALVLGPVGAVAGAIVGYTAGPSISQSLGTRQSYKRRHADRSSSRTARVAQSERNHTVPVAQATSAPQVEHAATAATKGTSPPPVQGFE
ncbi:MAG: hypothetical protein KGK16_18520 [Bradyrhizobium sp.]|nr:hypothetical protein [Bradyrhizobium sp.]MDE2332757.1 hypothetical protein [Bradyrhizobium sp.]